MRPTAIPVLVPVMDSKDRSTASAGTRDRTVLRVKIDGYIEGFVQESDAGSQAGSKVVISRSAKCCRLVNNRFKMKHLDTGYQPSVTRTMDIVSIRMQRTLSFHDN